MFVTKYKAFNNKKTWNLSETKITWYGITAKKTYTTRKINRQ